MTPLDRIREMLGIAGGSGRVFPATILYNEGWLLRLVLDWFRIHTGDAHLLQFAAGARWFSEASLPSQFLSRHKGDQLAEGWTHADGVVGHFDVGLSADPMLTHGAKQILVIEAKLFSPLSPGVTHARYYDQAARNVGCLAEVLHRAGRRPDQFTSLGFLLVAPGEQITAGVFDPEMTKESIREKVSLRVSAYCDLAKDRWFREWFSPTLAETRVECLSWEVIVDHVKLSDSWFGAELHDFYARCLQFNRPVPPSTGSSPTALT